jgi:hypothetical protein
MFILRKERRACPIRISFGGMGLALLLSNKKETFQKNRMIKNILCLAVTIVSGAASALAIPTTLSVDFRSTAWQAANGHTSDTVNNVSAVADFPPGSTLGWSSSGGLGVGGYLGSSTTIGPVEIMTTSFSLSSGQGLTGVWVTNLFAGTLLSETGMLVLDTTQGMKTVNFYGLQTSAKDALGDVDVSFGGSYNVLNATFFGVVGNYSVAGFTRQVPEGGTTLALLGMGLIGLSVLRSRKPLAS